MIANIEKIYIFDASFYLKIIFIPMNYANNLSVCYPVCIVFFNVL